MRKKDDKKIVFLILHYLVIEETVKCVDSIFEKLDTANFEIIIVDNASPNSSGKELKKKYENNDKIHVILNKENLGFSKGNNVGFIYAKNKLNADYICMTNNDTYLMQDDFFGQIQEEYNKSGCAVIGPEIHLLNGGIEHVRTNFPTIEDLEKHIKDTKKLLLKNKLFLESANIVLRQIVKKIIGYKKDNDPRLKNGHVRRTKNVILHGCCLIFTPTYINKFDGLNAKTFMYVEEELLFLQLKNNNMFSVYNPKIKIFHAERQATKSQKGRKYKKRRFIYENSIKATKILIKEMR